MPVKVKVMNSDETTVPVHVRRPAWQQFLHY